MSKRLIIRSEEDFVQGLLAPLAQGFGGALGLRDDAALIDVPVGSQLVVTTDALVAGVHFFADDAPEDIALKALGVNVSDLASKAADPLAYQLSLAMPRDLDTDWLARFADGLRQGQADWSLGLAGGDTVRTPGPLCLCVTAFGCVPTGAMVPRSGARTGDRLFVTGTLGDAALGLALRKDSAQAEPWALTSGDAKSLIGRYLRPEPRTSAVGPLRAHASAAMDISDGLVKDLGRLCATSGRGAHVDVASVPLSPAAGKVILHSPREMETVLTGGDDYEILAAVPESAAQTFQRDCSAANLKATAIGAITDDPEVRFIGTDGAQMRFSASGYDHF